MFLVNCSHRHILFEAGKTAFHLLSQTHVDIVLISRLDETLLIMKCENALYSIGAYHLTWEEENILFGCYMEISPSVGIYISEHGNDMILEF